MGDLVVADVGVYSDPGASLVTTALYQSLTGDTASEAADVALALVNAQAIVEEYLRRLLTSAERTETVRIAPNRRLYPAAYPVTAVETGSQIVDGVAILGPGPDGSPVFPGPSDATYPAVATITYTGGFSAATLPRTIANEIAWLAYRILHADDRISLPDDATSASVGDVSVSFAGTASTSVTLSQSAKAKLRPYRRRFV